MVNVEQQLKEFKDKVIREIKTIPGSPLGLVGVQSLLGKQRDPFSQNQSESIGSALIGIFNLVIFIYAFFLAFKCGGKFLDILGACCCSICYIPIRLAWPHGCNVAVN